MLIEIDPDTQTYSADYGMGGGISLARLEAVLISMLKEIQSGELLKSPGIETEIREDELDMT